jgi:hypothetical protein
MLMGSASQAQIRLPVVLNLKKLPCSTLIITVSPSSSVCSRKRKVQMAAKGM